MSQLVLAPEAAEVFHKSVIYAQKNSDEFITPEHLFYQIILHRKAAKLLKALHLDIEWMKGQLVQFLDENIPKVKDKFVEKSEQFGTVVEKASALAVSSGRNRIEITDFIVAIFDLKESFAAYLLKRSGLKRVDILRQIAHGSDAEEEQVQKKGEKSIDPKIEEGEEELFFDEDEGDDEYDDEEEDDEGPVLDTCTIDLTEKARNGELDPIIGREDVLKRTMQILLRRKKNNPIHVGKPGTGKTAITEGLASMIVQGKVPKQLLDHRILLLDISRLVAGTRYRGEFEKKMKKLVDELREEEKLIVFIDEIHTIVGAGSSGDSTLDASNLLKPILSEGSVKFIGATTDTEYRKRFEKDSALSRRFQKVNIEEPTHEECFLILKGLVNKYESFHNVKYSEEALRAAVELSARYISDRYLPDKAIDLIDEAGAFNTMETRKVKVIKPEQIERVLAYFTGKTEKTAVTDPATKAAELEPAILSEIFGQDEAVKAMVRAVKKSYAGFKPVEKPVASFLFAGPTGVGKTELAKVLADKMGVPLIRFDMSEYQEKHTVAKLFGAPPGYVGYDEGGLLTEAIRKQPTSVLLLDEIEKAHSDIYNSLLQIMDYATLTDSAGRKANFKNVIIIMTSNAGAKDMDKRKSGFGERSVNSSALKEAVKNTFTPEFRNRLDAIVYFSQLTPEIVGKIVRKNISQLAERLSSRHITLKITDAAVKYLADISFSKEFGARETARIIDEKMEDLLLDEVLSGRFRKGGDITIDFKDGTLTV